jgi:acyl-CoA dehydrogenase
MMNEARQKVGIQGLGIAERAYQQAREYARERVQGRLAGSKSGDRVTIVHHPDVRRMLMTMKAQVEAMRAFGYVVAADIDLAHRHADPAERRLRLGRVELLTPVLKAWCTELGVEIASLGVQVHGGMGYIEETGACQHLRDARIAPIYEGTTGIQAGDLVGRKLAADKGAAMRGLAAEMRATESALLRADHADLAAIAAALGAAVQSLEMTTAAVARDLGANPDAALAASVNYLMLVGYVCGGWQMGRTAVAARARLAAGEDEGFHKAKIATARFYADQVLPKASALAAAVLSGASTALAIDEAQL